ncbi:hypothetical protein LCM02_08215 [Lutimonas saemankumensis]|uniref:hypothetical protein n=1 Tax=Lutimonas saemankumensis TaxID=483016 RepID=UPI001CD5FFCA|nr:hypothetical protein [Lutimonas saemankumensis]MCA0932432.1 hypothetical protein [Lutimonas saemankumensis]
MIYTKYFAGILNEHGSLNLNSDQWRRVMNIVYLEGSIHSLRSVLDPKNPYKYDTVIFKYRKRLTDLTGNQNPENLIKEMYLLSKN